MDQDIELNGVSIRQISYFSYHLLHVRKQGKQKIEAAMAYYYIWGFLKTIGWGKKDDRLHDLLI